MRERVQQHVGPAREWPLALAVAPSSARVPSRVHRAAARPPAARASSSPHLREAGRTRPSPRFSTAGNHCGSRAICARSTSVSYSPWMSGVTASKRVNPVSARTSRKRWSWMTASMPSQRSERRQALSGSRRAWKFGINGHVVAKALGRREQRLELDLLHGPLTRLPALGLVNGLEDLLVREWSELLGDLRLLLHEGEVRSVLDDLEIVPERSARPSPPPYPRSGSDSTLTT